MAATENTFKGHPTLEMRAKPEDKYGLTIGVGKARLILDHLEAIKAFAEKHKGEKKGEA